MNAVEKKQAALELLKLRQWGTQMPPPLGDRVREVRAELYAEHFSEQQLKALLDFYGSDVGQTIVETESQIAKDFEKRVNALAVELNEEAAKKQSSGSLLGSFVQAFPTKKPRSGPDS